MIKAAFVSTLLANPFGVNVKIVVKPSGGLELRLLISDSKSV